MPSENYIDSVGAMRRSNLSAAYTGCIERHCPRCEAEPYETCTNPATGRPAKIPCIARAA